MTNYLKLNHKHTNFLFDGNDNLNIFNLVRLFRANTGTLEILLDVSKINTRYQIQIADKFSAFLSLYTKLVPNHQTSASLIYSGIQQELIDRFNEKYIFIQDNETLIFELNSTSSQKGNTKDPHFVKNIRGAVLLSLVQDLLERGSVEKKILIFDEKSSLFLHSASAFLHNEDNAKMMWSVLETWETKNEDGYKAEINRRIIENLTAKKELGRLTKELTRTLSNNSFDYFIGQLQSNIALPTSIYTSSDKLHLWFVDDQQANGWSNLIKKIIPESHVDIMAFNSVEDVSLQLTLSSFKSESIIPDLALVDLRLSKDDQIVETYDAKDLSGFEVVELLLKQWPGLPVMITSASSKLLNMEKAIEKGAVAYWRKSDEIANCENENAVLTAFDINLQFIEKLTLALKRAKYKYVFRVTENLRAKASLLAIEGSSLQRCIEKYAIDLEDKTSWMCWKKTDESKINDSLLLGVMEVFNEIEPLLWDYKSGKLVLVPNEKAKSSSDNSDNQVINKTLDFLDSKYNITGLGLTSRYEKCKNIRNKLPIIHGSVVANDFKNATLIDIETSLLIVWCLLNELVQKSSD